MDKRTVYCFYLGHNIHKEYYLDCLVRKISENKIYDDVIETFGQLKTYLFTLWDTEESKKDIDKLTEVLPLMCSICFR